MKVSRFADCLRGSDIGRTLVHAKNYLGADVAVSAMALLAVSAYTHLMTPEEFGIASLFTACLALGTVLVTWNAHSAVGRYIYEKDGRLDEFLGTTLILSGLLAILAAAAVFLFLPSLSALLRLPPDVVVCLVAASAFQVVWVVFYQVMVHTKQSGRYGRTLILRACLLYGSAVGLTWWLPANKYHGRVWATAAVSALMAVYLLGGPLRPIRWCVRRRHVRYIAGYSLPLVAYAISHQVLNRFDQVMLGVMKGHQAVAIYALGYNVALVLFLSMNALQNALIPDFMKMQDGAEFVRLTALLRRVFWLIAGVALAVVLFSQEFMRVFAEERYQEAARVVPVVVAGYVFFTLFNTYARYAAYAKKTFWNAGVVTVAAGINVWLNAIFIPRYGYMGSAYTTLLSYALMFALAYLVARHCFSLTVVPLGAFATAGGTLIACTGAYAFTGTLGLPYLALFLLKGAVLCTFFFAMYFCEYRGIRRWIPWRK